MSQLYRRRLLRRVCTGRETEGEGCQGLSSASTMEIEARGRSAACTYKASVTHKHNGLWKGIITLILIIAVVSDC